jgi:hypothetical protein
MDPDNRLSEAEADRRLRALFQQVGALHAPADLEERVLRALGPAPATARVDIAPLLPRWCWPAMGVLFTVLCLATLLGAPGIAEATGTLAAWSLDVDMTSLRRMFAHTSMQMGVLAMLCFAALELYLGQRRGVRVRVR